MQIDKSGPLHLQGSITGGGPAESECGATGSPPEGDSFAPSGAPGSLRLVNQAALFESKGLDKAAMDFRATSWASSPDGTLYVAYAASKTQKDDNRNKGYIAAISGKGEILWESPVADGGLDSLKVGGDGTLYAMTDGSFRALNPDGTLKFQHHFEHGVTGHWMDSSGTHYFTTIDGFELCSIDGAGEFRSVPECMKGLKCHEIKQPSPDTLYVRSGKAIHKLDLKRGEREWVNDFEQKLPQKSDWSQHIDHFDMEPGGALRIWIQNTFVSQSAFGPSGSHASFFDESVVTDLSMVKADEKGHILWRIESLGSSPINAESGDGSCFFSLNNKEYAPNPAYSEKGDGQTPRDPKYQPRTIPTGRVFVGKIDSAGKRNDSLCAVSEPVKAMHSNRESGNVLIFHGDGEMSEFDPEGSLVRRQSVKCGEERLYPFGVAGRETVLFKNLGDKKVFALDMEHGDMKSITETERDLSMGVITREIDRHRQDPDSEKSIEKTDEGISVDGIWLPVNKEEEGTGR